MKKHFQRKQNFWHFWHQVMRTNVVKFGWILSWLIDWCLTPILAILWHEQILQIKTTQIQDFLNKLETCVNKILNKLETCVNKILNKLETCVNKILNKLETYINQILCQHIKYVRWGSNYSYERNSSPDWIDFLI